MSKNETILQKFLDIPAPRERLLFFNFRDHESTDKLVI